jgi:hypothetical protein
MALGAGLVIVVAGCAGGQAVVGGCGGAGSAAAGQPIPSPACTIAPPEMTPWPASEQAAIAAANALTGRTDYALYDRVRDTPVWILRASDQAAVVNGLTGAVETFYPLAADSEGEGDAPVPGWKPLPARATPAAAPAPAVTEAKARAAAVAFLGAHQLAAGDGGWTRPDPAPGPVAWRVLVPDATGAGNFELRVDATSGAVTAFLRSTDHLYIDLPRIDRDTALRLAVAYAEILSGRDDLYPASVSSMISFVDQTQHVTWSVAVDPPVDPDGTMPNINANALEVDAATGGIAVSK